MSLEKSLERLEALTKKTVTAETDGSEISSSGAATLTMNDPFGPTPKQKKPPKVVRRGKKPPPRRKIKMKVKRKALAKVGELFEKTSYNAGKADSPRNPPSYKRIKAKRGPTGPLYPTQKSENMDKAKVDVLLSPKQKQARRQEHLQSKLSGQKGVHDPVVSTSSGKALTGRSTLGSQVARQSAAGTPQAAGSAYGHISDAKQRAKEQARGSVRQKLSEQRQMAKPKLPGAKPPKGGLDTAIERMRNMVSSFKSFKKEESED
jgi:hypothetical protein